MAILTIRVLADQASDAAFSPPETASIRLVARLPAQWRCTPVMAGGGFTLEIETPDGEPPAADTQAIDRAFAEAGLNGWYLAEVS
ncbi:hypothetical protein ACIBCA_14300 [Kitasatospora sp. NPDC051170]|uniref:hypothetical protein n=1 Tax=Kitasatospora sp. NPDC051170 TaxID=3364056 RepID=UPI00378A0949